MRSIDFTGKTVLVVGGTSGIGNGLACGFRDQGAAAHIWGTRPSLADYDGSDGCDYAGMHFGQMDIMSRSAIDGYSPPFDALDVLVLSQGDNVMSDGVSECCRATFGRVMRMHDGRIMDSSL